MAGANVKALTVWLLGNGRRLFSEWCHHTLYVQIGLLQGDTSFQSGAALSPNIENDFVTLIM